MKRRSLLPMVGLVVSSLVGCSTLGFSSKVDVSGFLEQLYKNSDYSIGQIVELNSQLKQVEITYDPKIPVAEVTVIDGWNLAADTADSILKNISTTIDSLVAANMDKSSGFKLSVALTDVKTKMMPKFLIFKYLQKELTSHSELRALVKRYLDAGREFDVITQIISARLSLTVTVPEGGDKNIGLELLKRISTKMNASFTHNPASGTYDSGPIAVGIISDPLMMKSLLVDDGLILEPQNDAVAPPAAVPVPVPSTAPSSSTATALPSAPENPASSEAAPPADGSTASE